MGLFDFLLSEDARKDAVAVEIDLEAGVLERCDVCRAVFDRGHARVALFRGDRDELLRRLRSAREPIPYNCICEDAG